MIICRTFLQSTIPEDLFQAAKLDGCSEFRLLLKVVLPLSKPVLAVLGLYYGVAHWNSYFNAMLYLTDKRLFPLQLVLRSILIMGQIDYTMTDVFDIEYLMQRMGLSQLLKYAVIVVASVPVMLIYPFAQKYFIKGMMIGSLKG
jgi:multiple sugar transport system permease protein/putative aldouronate transport system permease protein